MALPAKALDDFAEATKPECSIGIREINFTTGGEVVNRTRELKSQGTGHAGKTALLKY